MLPRNQSAYRKQHSTETALIRVLSDALAAADRRVTLLGLLHLSAAFDCVDHITTAEAGTSAWSDRCSPAAVDIIHSPQVGPSRSHTTGNCHQFNRSISACRKGRSWVRCCSWCTQLSSIRWSAVMVSHCISMPTIVKSIWQRWSKTHRLLWDVSLAV